MESQRLIDETQKWESVKKTLWGGHVGLWNLWTDKAGQKHLECDATMCELMGVREGIDPVEADRYLGERIEPEDLTKFMEYDRRLREEGRAEVLYRWHHPRRGMAYIRCCGWAEEGDEGLVLHGFHQDVTDLRKLNQDALSQLEASYEQKKEELMGAQASLNMQYTMIQALTRQYLYAYYIDLGNDTFQRVKLSAIVQESGNRRPVYEEERQWFLNTIVDESYREQVARFTERATLQERMKDQDMISEDYLNRKKRWVRAIFMAAGREADGTLRHVMFMGQNVDESRRKELQQRHQLSEENKQLQEVQRKVSVELETVMRGINGGYAILEETEGYPYLYASEELARMHGYLDVREFLKANRSCMNNIWEEDRDGVQESMRRQLAQGDIYSLKYRVICKDGSSKWVMESGRYTFENGRGLLRSILLDVDRHEKVNQMYREERRRYREALLHDCEYAITLNLSKGLVEDGYLVRQNVRTKLFRREDYPVSLKEYLDAVKDEIQMMGQGTLGDGSLREELVKEYRAGCRNKEFEYYDHVQDIYVRATVLMSENEEGDVNAIVMGRDITEQKRSQEEARKKLEKACLEAELANAAKSDFLARMSHDVRTPLNGILGLLEIAGRCAGEKDKVEECMKKAETAAKHLLSLLNDVLDMSKLESGVVTLAEEPFDLRELLRQIYDLMEGQMREKNIKGTNTAQKPLVHPYVIGSPSHVRQIITNLVSNAIKYNKEGGALNAFVEEESAEDGMVHFIFTISDTGIGMSQEFMQHIFEPFSREQDRASAGVGGTGLGMAIVKKLVDKMQGAIEVESEKGVGTTFRVMLPFKCGEQVEPERQEKEVSVGDLSGVRLLLVEDNELNRDVARYLLQDEHALVETADNGERAVALFSNHPTGYYDAILMDMMMPVLDGCGAARKIRAMERADALSIPIIALTANAFSDDIRCCREAGMNAHIAKPMEIRAAVRKIRQFVPQKGIKEQEKQTD